MRMYVGAVGDRYCEALLDGAKLKNCIVADDDEGWAICTSEDERGGTIVDPDYTEGIRTELRYGDVTLIFDPPIWRERAAEGLRQEGRADMDDDDRMLIQAQHAIEQTAEVLRAMIAPLVAAYRMGLEVAGVPEEDVAYLVEAQARYLDLLIPMRGQAAD